MKNGDMAVYLGKEILAITNYIHAISGDTCLVHLICKSRFITKVILLVPMVHIALSILKSGLEVCCIVAKYIMTCIH